MSSFTVDIPKVGYCMQVLVYVEFGLCFIGFGLVWLRVVGLSLVGLS